MDLSQLWQEKGAAEQDGVDLNRWMRASVDIVYEEREDLAFKLVWEATVGNKNLGNIAIDDVTFTPGCR